MHSVELAKVPGHIRAQLKRGIPEVSFIQISYDLPLCSVYQNIEVAQ